MQSKLDCGWVTDSGWTYQTRHVNAQGTSIKGKGKGKRSQKSEILTATPLKEVLEEKGNKRKEKELSTKSKQKIKAKKVKQAKKYLFKSSSSEESADEQILCDESGDSDLEIPFDTQNKRGDESLCTICLE